MKKITIILIIACIAIISMPAHSAMKKTAQSGLQILKIDVGARPAAMGGAYSMVGNDAIAMFYNPAGIAEIQSDVDFFATQTQWIADITYIAAGVVKNLGNWGNVGLSALTADYGDIIGTEVDPSSTSGYIETGNLDVSAYVVGLTYARSLTNKFKIGGQVKYAYQHLGENVLSAEETVQNDVSGLAFDFGTIFYPGYKSLQFGMSIRNFSQQFKFVDKAFQLPLTFSIGAAINVMDFVNEDGENALLLAVDALHPNDYTERLSIGLEYSFQSMFFIRGGYKTNHDIEGLSAGFGIEHSIGGLGLRIGYAYSAIEVFDPVSRISFGIKF
ncbi:PorV/PorQ family protein [candidate division KSB1 bacterium]|nr:PorV/PorQ family protein [candidate division KSB1 bacterium]